MADFRKLTEEERCLAEQRGCCAQDWDLVEFREPVDVTRLRNVDFLGRVRVGRLAGSHTLGALEQPCGIYEATIGNTVIGDGCLIRGVARISGYNIEDNVIIEDTGTVETVAGAAFGAGVEVEAINEGGGREVIIYPELSAQVAHIMALHRYRPRLIERLEEMIKRRIEEAKADTGRIGQGAVIRGVKTMSNVNIGPFARIEGAACLENGTILSESAAETEIGTAVILRDFIVAEGAAVTDAAILESCFVGQGARIGKGFSGENCLFFANCEAFHGEGCALFAGPYTVSHHKSSLLIGLQVSFYNAGSGTNQSNHMYKLGPVHQGILERGCKTGSFSYLLWPCRLGPFSVVIGKNMVNFDLGDLPFSYVSEEGGKTYAIPGFNLFTVGVVRDGAKWPDRDRRTASIKRDRIHFPVFNPYVVGKMIKAEAQLSSLAKETDRAVESVHYNGVLIKRVMLRGGAKWYRTGVDAYLAEKVVDRMEKALSAGHDALTQALDCRPGATGTGEWVDISGSLVPVERLKQLEDDIESGKIADIRTLENRLNECHQAFEEDEWNWVASSWARRYGQYPRDLGPDGLKKVIDLYEQSRTKFLKAVLMDARKEFSEFASIGFGADGGPEERATDFEQVRGTMETNKFTVQVNEEIAAVKNRAETLRARISEIA